MRLASRAAVILRLYVLTSLQIILSEVFNVANTFSGYDHEVSLSRTFEGISCEHRIIIMVRLDSPIFQLEDWAVVTKFAVQVDSLPEFQALQVLEYLNHTLKFPHLQNK